MGDTGSYSGRDVAQGFQGLKMHVISHKIEFALWLSRFVNIVFSLLYYLPFCGASATYHQKALISGGVTSALRLYQRQSRLRFAKEYLVMVCCEDSFHYLAYCMLFLLTKPIALVPLPVFLFSLIHFASYSSVLLDSYGANFWGTARMAISVIEFHAINILQVIALSEIFFMPCIVLLTALGHLPFTTMFIYYQFLMLRCSSRRNPYTKSMLHILRLSAENIANHRMLPGPVRDLIYYVIKILCKIGWYES